MYWRLQRLRDNLIYRRVFAGTRDAALYAQARYQPQTLAGPVHLHIRRHQSHPLLCRPGTTDAKVLWDTFHHRYHLPPRRHHPTGWIVDLGANVGYTAVDLAWRYPTARVLAVEMDPENSDVCAENVAALNSRCTLLRAAVWTEDGRVHYAGDEAWSFHISDLAGNSPNNARTAPARSLDSILDEFGITRVDYLKMDVEGAEAAILQDPGNWAARVRAMKVEIHPPAEVDECRRLLGSYGFRCTDDTVHPHCVVAVR